MWLKLALKSIPVILLGTLVFTAFIAGTAFAGMKLLAAKENTDKIPVALVVKDDNTYTRMALSYLLEEESIKEMCSFTEMTEEEAQKALENGQVLAAAVIPENFMSGVLHGGDVTAQVVLSDKGTTSQSKIFQKMIQSGATDLITAQAAIYAVDDLCIVTGIDAIRESEEYLNKNLLMYALRRNSYFGKNIISDTGDLSVAQFYIAGGIVLLLMLGGITCGELLKREDSTFVSVIYRLGIRPSFVLFAKLLGASAVYTGLMLIVYVAASCCKAVPFHWMGIPAVVVVVLTVFSVNLLIFQVAGSKMAGMLAGFMITIVMMFLSGNFIPASFLPKLVNDMGNFMPAKWITALCGQMLTGEIRVWNLVICIFIAVVTFFVTAVFQTLDRNFRR